MIAFSGQQKPQKINVSNIFSGKIFLIQSLSTEIFTFKPKRLILNK